MAPKPNRPPVKHIVVFGESGVGKTCFNDMFITGQHMFARYDPTGPPSAKAITVDGTPHQLELMDINSSLFHGPSDPSFNVSLYNMFLVRAFGFVLLYDITNLKSYSDITTKGYMHVYLNRKSTYIPPGTSSARDPTLEGMRYPCGRQRFGCVLVGMKKDLASEREVDGELAREWAESQGIGFWEVDKWDMEGIEASMAELVRDGERKMRRDREDIEEAEIMAGKKGAKVASQSTFVSIGEAFRQVLPKSKSTS